MPKIERRRYAMWVVATLLEDVYYVHCSEHGCLGVCDDKESTGQMLVSHINSEHAGTVTNVVVR